MAQIFVSHSAKDKELVALLSRAFAATKVSGTALCAFQSCNSTIAVQRMNFARSLAMG